VSRSRRAIWGYASVLLFTVVTAVTSLFSRPWLVAWLGTECFGAYRMVVDWYGYLTLLDLGLGGALASLLAQALGRRDAQALRGALAAGLRAGLVLTGLALSVGLAMLPLIVAVVRVQPQYVAGLRWCWLAILLSLLSLAAGPLRVLAEARQRGYWVNLMMTVQCLVITALSLVGAWAGWGLAGQGLAYALGVLLFHALLIGDAWRFDHEAMATALTSPPAAAVWRALWTLSGPTLLLSFCGRINLMTDNIVCGGLLGPAAVTRLVTTQQLALLAQGVLQAVGSASWAALAELHNRGDCETFRRRLNELTGLVAVLGVAGLGPIVAYNHHFFELWMRHRVVRSSGPAPLVAYGGDTVILVAAFNVLAQGLLSLWGWCFSGAGQQRRQVVPLALSAAVNLTASLLLTRELGLVGPLLGTTVALVTVSLWCLPLLLHEVFGIVVAELVRAVVVPLAWGLPYIALLWWVARAHQPWGWLGLAAEMGLAALGFLVLSAAAILGPDDRARWCLRWASLWSPRAEEVRS
jgi:O-antigen/teichoic acid export membrane protein